MTDPVVFPMDIYWVTGLRQKGWLFAETRYLKLALNRRAGKHVKIYRQSADWAFNWIDVTDEFLDEDGKKKW